MLFRSGSMRRAIDETNRRRKYQVDYNKVNNITPKSIVKKVTDIMETAYPVPGRGPNNKSKYINLGSKDLMKKANELERTMLQLARNLEFEEAARLRDEVLKIRELALELSV